MSFCAKCGANVPEGSKFCPVCGAPAEGAAPAAAQPAGAAPARSAGFQQPGQQGAAGAYGVPQTTSAPAGYAAQPGHAAPQGTPYAQRPGASAPGGYVPSARHHATAAGPVVAGLSLWTLIGSGALALAVIFLFQRWAEIPLGSIASSFGSSLPAGIPSTLGFGVLGLSDVGSLLSLELSSSLGSAASGAMGGLTGGAIFLAFLWAIALILSAAAVTTLVLTKGKEERPLLAAGIALVVLSVAWVIMVSGANSSIMSSLRAAASSFGGSAVALLNSINMLVATPFVWLTLVCGVVAILIPALKKFNVIR